MKVRPFQLSVEYLSVIEDNYGRQEPLSTVYMTVSVLLANGDCIERGGAKLSLSVWFEQQIFLSLNRSYISSHFCIMITDTKKAPQRGALNNKRWLVLSGCQSKDCAWQNDEYRHQVATHNGFVFDSKL